MVFTEIINVQNIMLFKNLKMQKLYYIRYKTGYLEDFMYKIDQEWGFFLSMIYEQPMYLDVFKLLKLCSECKIVFGIGNTETDSSFEDAFEFTPGSAVVLLAKGPKGHVFILLASLWVWQPPTPKDHYGILFLHRPWTLKLFPTLIFPLSPFATKTFIIQRFI